MPSTKDLTLGDAVRLLKRYPPAVVIPLVLALLLVVLPEPERNVDLGDEPGTEAMALTAPDAGSGQAVVTAGSAASTAVSGTGRPGTAPGDATVASAAAAAPTMTGEPGAAPAVESGRWPGLGTPAALAAPDCDRATGYLRLQTRAWNLPCVPLWPTGADNGGATAPGVTADAIKVVVYYPENSLATEAVLTAAGINDTNEQMKATMAGWAALFNRHAELYGRKIQLINVDGSGTGEESERADAIDTVNRHHPFAVISPNGGGNFQYQMARRKVVAVMSGPELLGRFRQASPYYWQATGGSTMLYEQHNLFLAELICKRLRGRAARWAGDPLQRTLPRKFGWLYIDAPDYSDGNNLFREQLKACGVTLNGVGLNAADMGQAQEQITTAIARFKADSDNVVVLNCTMLFGGVATKQATNQNFRPEWLGSGYGSDTATIFVRSAYDPTQARALYGFKTQPIQPAIEKSDSWGLYRWEHGHDPESKLFADKSQIATWNALATGIQLAGPTLNPLTFRDGMLRMPPIGGFYSGSVTSVAKAYGRRGVWPWERHMIDTTGVDDTTFTWWDSAARGQDESGKSGVGMMMFVDGGKRYRLGAQPTTEPDFFNPANGTADVDELTGNDRPTTYPNRRGCTSRQSCWASG